jgi:hypothetical protein
MKKPRDFSITGKISIAGGRVLVGSVEVPVYSEIVRKWLGEGKKTFDAHGYNPDIIYEFRKKWFGRYNVKRLDYPLVGD